MHASVAGGNWHSCTPLRESSRVPRLYGASVLDTAPLLMWALPLMSLWSSLQKASGCPGAPVTGGDTKQPCMFHHQVRWLGNALSSDACLV